MHGHLKWLPSLLAALLLTACLHDGTELDSEDKFGIIDDSRIQSWSALWYMSQNGSIEFCIRDANDSEERKFQQAARGAVDGWLNMLNDGAPASGYTPWNRSSVNVRFGCSRDSYSVTVSSMGGGVCDPQGKSIEIGRDVPDSVFTHEFGHAMGLGDTYDYNGGNLQGQPDSMMQSAQRFTNDDRMAIWSLWHFINTGNIICGPGYVRSSITTSHGDPLCEPGDSNDGDDDYYDDDDDDNCVDNNSNCSDWASNGFCEGEYANWMSQNCCASCQGTNDNSDDDTSNDNCVDNNSNCSYWASNGFCEGVYANWMSQNCCASCQGSNDNSDDDDDDSDDECQDISSRCAENAWQCDSNQYVRERCCATCRNR